MKKWWFVWGGLALTIALVVACGPAPTATPPPATRPPTATSPLPTPAIGGGDTTPVEDEAAPLVQQAVADLSQRLGLEPQQIHVQSVESVMWRDSSLGCPQPGMNYLTVITPGYLIRLEAEGQVYEYHTSKTLVTFCENPQQPLEKDGSSD